ncbi:dihydrolipoamide acetyltransferase family protein [Marimonas sp. MJW-29]|uniref:Dihydrolipoamide acetyltransferase component of pyruvate dehydrogenase complex n=1 Tax=Sulfitobacter sediminis TaxID=3234186 RepID=A0ABV3RRF4_9RHOB
MGVFTLPSLGSDMEAGTLVEWLIAPGDTVHRGDIVAVIETQKGAIEIECFEEGTVENLLAETGAKLPVGAPLAQIRAPGEAAFEPVAETEPAAPAAVPVPPEPAKKPSVTVPTTGEVRASPAARRRAQELNVDLATLDGSFPDSGIVLADVEAAAGKAAAKPAKTPLVMEEMRRAIGAAMSRSKRTIPHFYLSQTIDIEPAKDWLAAHNAKVPPAERVLMGALLVRAVVRAATKVRVMNGHYTDDAFHPSERVNAGVAVALRGGGLVAPALIDADRMSLAETMVAMRDLVSRARAGRLRNSEMTEGTITISSLGETGAEEMTGVIFPPQVALVCLGTPQVRPWVVRQEVVPRTVVTLSLSADHRVSDGRQGAEFIAAFMAAISDPENL